MAVFMFTLGNALSLKDDGSVNSGGKLYFLEPGTSTPKVTYTTSALAVENDDPVVCNSAGRASVYFEGDADCKEYDSDDVLIRTNPNVNSSTNSTISALSSNTTLDSEHNTNFIEASGTTTLTLTAASTLGAGWYVNVKNAGVATVTIGRASVGDSIDGTAANATISPGASRLIIVNAAETGFMTLPTLPTSGSEGVTHYGTVTMSSKAINEAKGSDITAASTTDIGAATGNAVDVTHTTGTVAITGLGTVQAGTRRIVRFQVSGGTLTITHNASSLALPGAANITVSDDDVGEFVSLGSGNWYCVDYTRADGKPVIGAITSGTLTATTSGTTVEIATGIPSWVKRIIGCLSGVSTNGSTAYIIQIGDTDGYETSGYSGTGWNAANAGSVSASLMSSGFKLHDASAAGVTYHGIFTLVLMDAATNLWAFSATGGRADTAAMQGGGGTKALTATLDRIRINTTNGTDTFDAGSITILYE